MGRPDDPDQPVHQPAGPEADYRRRFWADYHAAYAALKASPDAWAEFQREIGAWDATLADGLETNRQDAESP